MKNLIQFLMGPFRGDGMNGGVMGTRLAAAGARGGWAQAVAGGSPPRRVYPPPVYRREEDLYVIGEHAGNRRGADRVRTKKSWRV